MYSPCYSKCTWHTCAGFLTCLLRVVRTISKVPLSGVYCTLAPLTWLRQFANQPAKYFEFTAAVPSNCALKRGNSESAPSSESGDVSNPNANRWKTTEKCRPLSTMSLGEWDRQIKLGNATVGQVRPEYGQTRRCMRSEKSKSAPSG